MLLRRIVSSLILLFAAQVVLGQHWKAVRIPQDSIRPILLKFSDSLTGYFCGAVPVPHEGSSTGAWLRYSWYRTMDGGRSWVPIDFGGLFVVEPNGFDGLTNSNLSAYGNKVILNPRSYSTNDSTKVLIVSTNRGASWIEQASEPENILNWLEFKATFADNYHIGTADYPAIGNPRLPVETFDGGKTFQYIEGDETFRQATTDTTDKGDLVRRDIDLACSTPDKWTAFILGDTLGLKTLITTNGGSTWTLHRFYLPDDSSFSLKFRQHWDSEPHFIRKTSSLYLPMLPYYSAYYFPAYKLSEVYSNRTFFKLSNAKPYSYLYSSDYGATWEAETTFHKRKVAFEAVAPGEVWMTLWRYENLPKGVYADVIAHTTDYGKTWEVDSTTLHPREFSPHDGAIICFTDRNHGWIAGANEYGTTIFRYIPAEASADTRVKLSEYNTSILRPNPAGQSFTARLALYLRLQRIEIYDVLGRNYPCPFKLHEDNTATVDCSGLAPGYYFVKMVVRDGSREKNITRPIAVQR